MTQTHKAPLVARLLERPLFAGLDPASKQRLVQGLRHESLDEGEIIFSEGQPPERVSFLMRGEVAATQLGDLVHMFNAPAALGLLSLVDGEPFTATMTAFTHVELLTLDKAIIDDLQARSTSFRRNLVDHFAREVRALHERNLDLRRSLDDFFESPNARMVPGPYVADPFDMYFIVVEHDPRKLGSVLPEGLSPIPGTTNKYLLTFAFFERVYSQHPAGLGKTFKYNETVLFFPCLGPNRRPSVYAPELYPDNHLAITIGRELYGFPKRFGQTERNDQHINLVLNKRLTLRASWGAESPSHVKNFIADSLKQLGGDRSILGPLGEAAGLLMQSTNTELSRGLWPSVPVFVHRQVPDVQDGATNKFVTDELIEVPFRITSLGNFTKLEDINVSFLDESYFLGGRALVGYRYRIGFAFGRSKHWANYRTDEGDEDGIGNRLRGWWRGT